MNLKIENNYLRRRRRRRNVIQKERERNLEIFKINFIIANSFLRYENKYDFLRYELY